MNIGGIVQAYTALAAGIANRLIAGNIAGSSLESAEDHTITSPDEQATVKEAASAGTKNGVAAAGKAALPDARPAQNGANLASQTLAGLRLPGKSVASNADSLTKLATSYLASMVKGASASQSAALAQSASTLNAQEANQQAGQAAVLASLARNAARQAGTSVQSADEADAFPDASAVKNQQANDQLSAEKRKITALIPSYAQAEAKSAEESKREAYAQFSTRDAARFNEKAAHLSAETALSSKSPAEKGTQTSGRPEGRFAQASTSQPNSSQTSLGQASLEELLNHTRLERPRDGMLNALGHEQLMGRMQGMDAAILNAAMIPGWPAARPFEMPKQINEAQARRLLAQQAEQATQLGTSTQRQSKDEAAIQTYLLNMGMKKSLLSKIRAALRPAKQKIKLLFGLAVLVSQAVFTLHTVLDELNSMEEDEDDMMQDRSEQQRRLKG